MKKYLILFVTLLSLLITNYIFAQQKKATYIYRNDNVFDAYACSEIDSITYEEENGIANQVIWTKDGVNKIPVATIDSVSFEVPKTIFMQIPEEDLNGWEFGYSIGNEYIVAYIDESDNTLVTMTNKSGEEADKGLILCFNDDYDVVSIGTMSKLYDVKYEDNTIILYRINEDGFYEEEIIPVSQMARTYRNPRKGPSPGDALNFISKGADFIGNVQSGKAIGSDVLNWDWGQMVRDGLWTAGGFLVGKANPIAGFVLTVGQWPVDHYRKQDEERKRAAMYGNCEISIDKIRPENGNSVVYATVKNADALHDYLVNMYDRTENAKTRNLVSCGIVVRAHNEHVNTHLYDYKSQETQLNGYERYGSVANLSFTIPGLDLTKNLSTYYFRPYLTSTRVRNSHGDVHEGHVKYGETVPYTAFNGEIVEFKQYSADYSTDMDGYGFVHYFTRAHATITSLDNVEEWGVYILEEDGTRYEPSEFKAAKLEDWITLYFNINKIDYDEINNDYFFASKKIKMGVYQKLKDPTGNYDYLSYFYSEPQEYELTYEEKPLAITIGTISTEKTAATVKCQYKGFGFWNALCGVEYTTNSNTMSKTVYPNDENVMEIQLTNLTPNSIYSFRAYCNINGKKEYGSSISFTTKSDNLCPDDNHPHMIDMGLSVKWSCCNVDASKPEENGGYYAWGETEEKSEYTGSNYKYYNKDRQSSFDPTLIYIGDNISGTDYDVAHVKWGGSWCMPSNEDAEELLTNCSQQYYTINGQKGILLKSKINEAKVFFPEAGWRETTQYVNGYNYWLSTAIYDNLQPGHTPYYLSGYYSYLKISLSGAPGRHGGFSVRPISR